MNKTGLWLVLTLGWTSTSFAACIGADGVSIEGAPENAEFLAFLQVARDKHSTLTEAQLKAWAYANYPLSQRRGRLETPRSTSEPTTGVLNPKTHTVEWKDADSQGYGDTKRYLPYAGVFNPVSGHVEWKKADYEGYGAELVALPWSGVFNPVRGVVEWKKADYEGYGASRVALPYTGAFDPATGTVVWKKADYQGYDEARVAVPKTVALNARERKLSWKDGDYHTTYSPDGRKSEISLPQYKADGRFEWKDYDYQSAQRRQSHTSYSSRSSRSSRPRTSDSGPGLSFDYNFSTGYIEPRIHLGGGLSYSAESGITTRVGNMGISTNGDISYRFGGTDFSSDGGMRREILRSGGAGRATGDGYETREVATTTVTPASRSQNLSFGANGEGEILNFMPLGIAQSGLSTGGVYNPYQGLSACSTQALPESALTTPANPSVHPGEP